MRSGDQLWEFKLRGMGRKHRGVKLVRNGKAIDSIVAEVVETKPPAPQIAPRRDPWDLIESGQHGAAIERLTARIRRDKSERNYANRAIAYLDLGEYDRALADFRAAEAAGFSDHDAWLQSIGVAQWLAGRESEAASTWRDLVRAQERGKIHYTDAAGGVESPCLLWFAAVRLGQQELLEPARRLLKEKVSPKNGWIENWPGPIAKFLLGRITEEQLRSQAEPEISVLRERELCQAEFYIGVRRLQSGDRAGAKRAFQAASSLILGKIENEYYLAVHESKRPLGKVGARKGHG